MYKFKYELSEHDYLEFNKFHMFNTPDGKRYLKSYRNFGIIIFMVFGLAFGAIGAVIEGLYVFFSFVIAFVIVIILWVIFAKRIMVIYIKRNIEGIKKSGKLPYQNRVTISFEDDFIIETTADGELKAKYSSVQRVIVGEEAIYIYIGETQTFLLPFSVFTEEQKRDDFVKFIEEKSRFII